MGPKMLDDCGSISMKRSIMTQLVSFVIKYVYFCGPCVCLCPAGPNAVPLQVEDRMDTRGVRLDAAAPNTTAARPS